MFFETVIKMQCGNEVLYVKNIRSLIDIVLTKTSMILLLFMRRSSPTAFRVFPPLLHRPLTGYNNNKVSNVCKLKSFHRYMTIPAANPAGSGEIRRDAVLEQLSMENIYQKWTLSQDQILWENRFESTVNVAILLGRGLRGTKQRLAKLRILGSPAYLRLFAGKNPSESSQQDDDKTEEKKKLAPSWEVLRRIQWDETLSSQDFFVVHYDRVDDILVETPVDAPNESISGKATKFIDALPEHRIVAVKYKERAVWDRATRFDCFFAGEGIMEVIRTYDDWKKKKDEDDEHERQRRAYISTRLEQILGMERFDTLIALWTKLNGKSMKDPTLSLKLEAEKYVKSSLELFNQIWSEPEISLMPQWAPSSELESLEKLSELVVLYPDSKIRTFVLDEISLAMLKADGKFKQSGNKLPELDEKELTETFIRGSGPGGQKVNKTSNRVCLVHNPTQLRVECQDTRSLPQNRKIARKRLREKLDEHLNGSQSKANIDAQRASQKKVKAKARSRARIREKQNSNESDDAEESEDDGDDVFV